jgi:hypothetical protein
VRFRAGRALERAPHEAQEERSQYRDRVEHVRPDEQPASGAGASQAPGEDRGDDHDSRFDRKRIARTITGATAIWDTSQTNTSTGAYDAPGRLPLELADNSVLQTSRSYGSFSGQLSAYSITPTNGQSFFDSSGYTWAGTKLKGYSLKSRYEMSRCTAPRTAWLMSSGSGSVRIV